MPQEIQRPNGRWLRFISHQTADKGVLCLYSDITDIKNRSLEHARLAERNAQFAEALQKARDEAERANKVKSAFLATMSHEIRTPLNSILGTLGLIRDDIKEGEPRYMIDTALKSAEALLSLLNDILDFSKIEAGKLELEETSFAVRDLAVSTVDIMRRQADQKNLELKLEISANAPEWMCGDAGRIRQILLNLTSNAIKFTTTGSVTLAIARGEGMVRFSVTDTGVGIAPRDVPLLFRDFSQLDSGHRHEGTGLGLAICQRLVQAMGGDIGVSSDVGHGSVFWFSIPLKNADIICAEARPALNSKGQIDLTGIRALVVEDNATNQMIALNYLRKAGCVTDVASDGLEALAALASFPYDVVLMDMSMPNCDGVEATKYMRASENAMVRDVPVIAMTAHAMPEHRKACLEAGMQDFLNKPIIRDQMLATVQRWAKKSEIGKDAPMTEFDQKKRDMRDVQTSLERIAAEVGHENFQRLLEVFTADIKTRMAKIAEAVECEDMVSLRHQAHALKGSAANLGFSRLTELLMDLEQRASMQLVPEDSFFTRLREVANSGIAEITSVLEAKQG